MARLLEESGHAVLVILLTATPHTFTNLVNNLGLCDSFKLNKKIASILLNLDPDVSIAYFSHILVFQINVVLNFRSCILTYDQNLQSNISHSLVIPKFIWHLFNMIGNVSSLL